MLTALLAASALAAPITWEAPADTRSAGDILNVGSTVDILNASQNSELAVLNNVAFPPGTDLFGQQFPNRPLDGNTTGDAALDALLDTFDHGNASTASIEIGGGNLQVGQRYAVQVFFTDLRSCCGGRTMTFSDGLGNAVSVDGSGGSGSFGQYAIGTFVADDDVQTLEIASNSGQAHITGYQVRSLGVGELLVSNALSTTRDVELVTTGYAAGEVVGFAYSDRRGSSPLPGCNGVALDIARPRFIGTAVADASGRAALSFRPPTSTSGDRIHIHSGSVASCTVGARHDVDVD